MSGDDYKNWDPTEAIEALKLETEAIDFGDPKITANKVIQDASPAAALSMTHLALYSGDERMRFQASRYILDYTLKISGGADDPIESLIKKLNAESAR